MKVINRENADHYIWGEVCEGWRLLAGQDLSVTQELIPPGRGEVRHYHNRARQLFFVLRGVLYMEANGEKYLLRQGDSIEIPPAQLHRVSNHGNEDAEFLVVSAPTTQGDRINAGE